MKITEVLQLLSDPTRLRMLRLLSQEELSVAELQEVLEMGQSRISSHSCHEKPNSHDSVNHVDMNVRSSDGFEFAVIQTLCVDLIQERSIGRRPQVLVVSKREA
mgnify:CR=1 FL=1